LLIARPDVWRYSKFAYSQGGAKFPTGGKSASVLKARERFRLCLKVSRSGVIPGPTVKVRMGEGNDF
jgi:3,4-dihydroxy 2-butanone 4-phosphate synthase